MLNPAQTVRSCQHRLSGKFLTTKSVDYAAKPTSNALDHPAGFSHSYPSYHFNMPVLVFPSRFCSFFCALSRTPDLLAQTATDSGRSLR